MNVVKKAKKLLSMVVGGVLSQVTGKKAEGEKVILPEMVTLSRKSASDGIVMLANDNVLPLACDTKVAVFGRCQFDYFCVGYGSGGDVNAFYKKSFYDGLVEKGACINESVVDFYNAWRKKNPVDEGVWGLWPFSHEEAILPEDLVKKASEESEVAIVVIGRAAGEDRENKLKEGSYYLTRQERDLLSKVTKAFAKTIVVMNCGNVMDMSFVGEYGIKSVLYAWQGGMESGTALTDVIFGTVNPSGKLTMTIAKNYEDYPSANNFGNAKFNNYVEDIYVGYRYFETFKPSAVLYPFGYGLSYTNFEINASAPTLDGDKIKLTVSVKNVGKTAGKEVVQIYVNAPQGKLGKPKYSLVAYKKTPNLSADETYQFDVNFSLYDISSYDDTEGSSTRSSYVLERGEYGVFVGNSVKNLCRAGSINIEETVVTLECEEVMSVKDTFKALDNQNGKIGYRNTPKRTVDLAKRIESELPEIIEITGDKGYKLKDVKYGNITMDQFIAQLSIQELARITCGGGAMNSKLGTGGNAGSMGGVSKSLRDKGIPALIPTDGPSGIRLNRYVSLIPCGTCLACTWDDELVEELMEGIAKEMAMHGSDILLAPGLNIHRNPLCGRNFEYFSEDPVVSGKIASAYVKGVQKNGLSACPKHFACNNQERNRNRNDSRVTERALREIYLKGFEICVKESNPRTIMTSYNKVNGVWSHYNYELCYTVLRKEWGFDGLVMTDWWMQNSVSPEFKKLTNNAYRVRAHVDVLMPGGKSHTSAKIDNSIIKSYRKGGITIGELQNTARTILNLALEYIE